MGFSTPPPEGGSSQFRPSRHEIDFGVIGESFNLIFQNWKVYAVPGAITMLLAIPGMLLQFIPIFVPDSAVGQLGQFTIALASMGASLVGAIIAVLFNAGIVRYTWNRSRGLGTSSMDVWEGFRDPWGYFAVMFLVGLLSALGVVACCFGIYFVAGMLMFALPIKVVEGCTATDAVSRSFAMLKKDWFLCGVMFFVLYLLSSLGMFACYVGLILTMPVVYVAPTLLYSQYVGMNEPMRPESPTNYPRG